jgi:hypothetical protein
MISIGVTFWQMPDDETEFFRYLARAGDVYAIEHMEAVSDPMLLSKARPIHDFLEQPALERLYISPAEYALHPPLHICPPESARRLPMYSLDMGFPAIMYTPGRLKKNKLSQSNASAYTTYWDPIAKKPVRMPETFVRWARRVMAWIRRATPAWHEYRGYRATKPVAEAALSGLVLVHHGLSGKSTGESSFMPGGETAADA